MDRMLTVKDMATAAQVSPAVVKKWFETGELKPSNMGASSTSRKPRLRVRQTEYERFVDSRTAKGHAPPRRRRDEGVTQYYK